LARWLASQDNRYFARAWVNRLWQSLMGRGLVHPADDLRDTNPATHPELLDRLAADFAENQFDLRHTLQLIVSSAAYQRAASSLAPLEGGARGAGALSRDTKQPLDDRFFSHALTRPIPMPVLIRLICQATEVPGEEFDQAQADDRIAKRLAERQKSDPLGLVACDGIPTGRKGQPGPPASIDDLTGQIQWLNGPLVNKKLADPRSAFVRAAAKRVSNRLLVEEYFFRTLSRLPSPAEAKFWEAELVNSDRAKRCEDFAWSLLSCPEFVTNH
jgi:hypothetical protein